jgi:hypothetical protein
MPAFAGTNGMWGNLIEKTLVQVHAAAFFTAIACSPCHFIRIASRTSAPTAGE